VFHGLEEIIHRGLERSFGSRWSEMRLRLSAAIIVAQFGLLLAWLAVDW